MKFVRVKQFFAMALILSILSSCNTTPNTVPKLPKTSPLVISRIKMFNHQKGWGILNFGTSWIVVHTSNAGATWAVVTPSGSTTRGGISGDFISSKVAWVVFNTFENLHFSSLATTNNSGKTWQLVSLSKPLLAVAYNIFFQTPTQGWALEKNGLGQQLIQVQLDKAKSKIVIGRTISSANFGVSLRGIKFSSSNVGWVSTAGSKYPELIKTNNSGSKWFLQKLPKVSSNTNASCATSLPQFSSTTTGVVESSCTVRGLTSTQFYITTNAGTTWIKSSLLSSSIADPVFSSFGTYIWVVGIRAKNKVNSNLAVAITSNSGHSWRFYKTPFKTKFIQSINFFNTSMGTALVKTSKGTTLWKTLDGGLSWSKTKFTFK